MISALLSVALGASPNLLQNPSLEEWDDAGVPTCWQHFNKGSPPFTAVWAQSSESYDGQYAQQLEVSGDGGTLAFVQLGSAQDDGTCAPAMIPTDHYRVSGYYQSTGSQPRFASYVRTSGTWGFESKGPLLETTDGGYSFATWDFTGVQGATYDAVSVGMSMDGPGTLLADDFSLVDLDGEGGVEFDAGPSTIVTLGFDDAWADQLQAQTLLSSHGMHATFFIVSGWLGGTNHMTTDDVVSLQQAGNEIGGHTVSHPFLNSLSPEDAFQEICNDRAYLIEAGFSVTSFAYPHGADAYATDAGDGGADGGDGGILWQIVSDVGYNSGRDLGRLLSPPSTTCQNCPFSQALPVRSDPGHELDVFHTRTPDSIHTYTTLAEMETYVTQAENHEGGWVQIVMHHVCRQDPCEASVEDAGVTVSQLSSFLDFLAAEVVAGRVQVLRTDEVITGAVKPVVLCAPLVDAGPDAGDDAGPNPDSGAAPDAGTFDAGLMDSGVPEAHEYPDTGPAPDAGHFDEDGGLTRLGIAARGCYCSSSGPVAALWLALPLVFLRRRRGSRSS